MLGFDIGADYSVANYTQISTMLKKWDEESDRLKVVSIGNTAEGRAQYMAIITAPANWPKIEHYREISRQMARATVTPEEAAKLAIEGKATVWIDGGLHATETVNAQSLAEMVYQMVSRTDAETLRFLDDVILLMPVPNPDGVELVANWYMRNEDKEQRSLSYLPVLYHKYVGHDNNRDSIMHNMPETANQNRVMFIDWYPQIMHNVHQTGPAGSVVFIPPFRGPFNYDNDPLIPLGIDEVGIAMHRRLVSKGMGGSAMRTAAPYSIWFNGNMRTAGYFRNQIGILTEIIGNPTPTTIPLIAEKQLPNVDWPMPIKPQIWHYRQSIDYMIELERAIVDYASRNKETLLYNRYEMGRRAIAAGSQDSWLTTPKRIAALQEAAARGTGDGSDLEHSDRERSRASLGATGRSDAVVGAVTGPLPSGLYDEVLHDPAFRQPRGYIISADQADFPTAVKLMNVLIKGGVEVHKATASFTVGGKTYPAGSYVVKSAQAFRSAVMDSFEAQDHPMDFAYPGGPPVRPYDITGWTVARQMGVDYDRILDGFEGPFVPVGFDLEKPPVAEVTGPANPAGWLVSHKINDAFIVMNRLLKAGADVYWIEAEQTVDGRGLGTGTWWVPAATGVKAVIAEGAKSLGVAAHGVATAPKGAALKLKPARIGLIDQYGGSMPSGWMRWILEQFEFPYEVVFPQILDAGSLNSLYDVVLFPSDTYSGGRGGRARAGMFRSPPVETIPEEYRSMIGTVTADKSIPPLKVFVAGGGTLITMGSSAPIAEDMGFPVEDHLATTGEDGELRPYTSEEFYIPGSVLRVKFDNTNPVAYGMPSDGYLFFDSSPVFKIKSDDTIKPHSFVWFDGKEPLFSGWAVGQDLLDQGVMAMEASVGNGKIIAMGVEATFRGTPHQTYKLLFNGIYYGSATPVTLE